MTVQIKKQVNAVQDFAYMRDLGKRSFVEIPLRQVKYKNHSASVANQ